MEAMIKPFNWMDFNKDFRLGFKMMRAPVIGWFLICIMNVFVKQIMPKAIIRKLTPEEKKAYKTPFRTIRSRKPVRRWPCEIPIDGKPADMHKLVGEYSHKLEKSDIPKLLIYASPGGIIDAGNLEWCKKNIKNLETRDIGKGIHFLQEDHPREIGEIVEGWYKSLPAK